MGHPLKNKNIQIFILDDLDYFFFFLEILVPMFVFVFLVTMVTRDHPNKQN